MHIILRVNSNLQLELEVNPRLKSELPVERCQKGIQLPPKRRVYRQRRKRACASWQAASRQSAQIGAAPAQNGGGGSPTSRAARSPHCARVYPRPTAGAAARCGGTVTRHGRTAARQRGGAMVWRPSAAWCGGAPAPGSSTARPTRARVAVRTKSGAATWRYALSRGRPDWEARLQQLEGSVAASVAPRLRRAGRCDCCLCLHGASTITVGAAMLPAAELQCAELELIERPGQHLGQVGRGCVPLLSEVAVVRGGPRQRLTHQHHERGRGAEQQPRLHCCHGRVVAPRVRGCGLAALAPRAAAKEARVPLQALLTPHLGGCERPTGCH
eukprot:scaffold102236_cov67-Phaeocystis_antarctica.AAC.3